MAEAYGKWLNSLTEPTAITFAQSPSISRERASAIEHAAPGLPHPALRHCAHTYAQFLSELANEGEGSAPPSNPARAEHPQPRAQDRQGRPRAPRQRDDGPAARRRGGASPARRQAGRRAVARRAGTTGAARRLATGRSDPPMLRTPFLPRARPRTDDASDRSRHSLPAPSAVRSSGTGCARGTCGIAALPSSAIPREVNQGWLAPLLQGRRRA